MVHRGVDFRRPEGGGQITLDWKSDKTERPEGGDLCIFHKEAADSTMLMYNLVHAVTLAASTTDQAAVDALRPFFYVCYQGKEESENTHFSPLDNFVKLGDVYLSLQLKNIEDAQFGEIEIGDTLRLDDAGYLGTDSITLAHSGTGFDGTDATIALITGTKVVGKTMDKDIDGNDVYVVSIVC